MTETNKKESNQNKFQNDLLKKGFISLLDSAIIITFITSSLYVISFFYLKGFYNYYGLIDIDIDFSIFRIIKTCLEIFQSLFPWILIYSLLSILISKLQEKKSIKYFFATLWMFLLFLIFIKNSQYTTNSFLQKSYTILAFALIGGVIIAYIIINFLPQKFFNKTFKIFNKKNKTSLFYIYKIILFLNSLMIIINFIPNYGFNDAKIKKDYLYDSQQNKILIYQDNEKSILLSKNENNLFEKKYTIIQTSELSNYTFEHYKHEIIFMSDTTSNEIE